MDIPITVVVVAGIFLGGIIGYVEGVTNRDADDMQEFRGGVDD